MILNVNSGAGKIPVNIVPDTASAFVYDGSEKTPVWQNYDPEQLMIGGTAAATNAGVYTVYFVPNSDYEWWDGTCEPKYVEWTIEKAAGTLSLSETSGTLLVKGRTTTFTINTNSDGAITVNSSNTAAATVSISGKTVTVKCVKGGSSTITVDVAESANYTAPDSKTYSVTTHNYLYYRGDRCTEVTGGWGTRGWTYASGSQYHAQSLSVTYNSSSVKLVQSVGANTYVHLYTGVWETLNNISLSGVSKIRFRIASASVSGGTYPSLHMAVSSRASTYCGSSFYASASISSSSASKDYYIDVSSLNSSYDILVELGIAQGGTITVNVSEIELI